MYTERWCFELNLHSHAKANDIDHFSVARKAVLIKAYPEKQLAFQKNSVN